MLSNHYNRAGYAEMIVDAKAWRDNLPESVEALFYPKHTCAIGSPCMETTKAAHAALLKAYRLTAKDIPLLTLDVRNLEAPFEDTHARGAADGYSSHALWAG